MLFRQLFERDSSTYTYLIADRSGGGLQRSDLLRQLVEQMVAEEARGVRISRA